LAVEWTEERRERLFALYKQGLSYGEIARILSTEFNEQLTLKAVEAAIRRYDLKNRKDKEGLLERQKREDEKEQFLQRVIDIVQSKQKIDVNNLADILNCPPREVREAIDILSERGYQIKVELDDKCIVENMPMYHDTISLEWRKGGVRFLAISDTHLGSAYQQLHLLYAAYKYAEDNDVDFVIHCGDLTDGVGVYRGQEQHLFLRDSDNLIDYIVEYYPRSRIPTYMIAGNHDWSFVERRTHNILRYIAQEIPNLYYIGDKSATLLLGQGSQEQQRGFPIEGDIDFEPEIRIDLLHPRSGAAYAKSYKHQKYASALIEEVISYTERRKRQDDPEYLLPTLLLIGHYHFILYVYHLGMHTIGLPALQAQTPYLKEKGLVPNIGFVLCELWEDAGGGVKFSFDYINLDKYVVENGVININKEEWGLL